MSENEIIGGLRNALERGESIQKAVQSFISAGYNPILVQEAANELSTGVTSIINPSALKPSLLQFSKEQPKQLEGKRKNVVIGLIITFAILIVILIILLVFREKIIQAFS